MSAAPACSDDEKMTEPTTAATADATDSTTTGTSSGTTMDPMVTGTDTGAVPECTMIKDQPTCEATPLCMWPPEESECMLDCMKIDDEAACMATQEFCTWVDGKCEMLLI
ncbi:hypothetical protein [Nannocystis pusilla]|uniref:hypothetical protein n=1 Tax=Nannocystis pusilla TaxID=889268 RepID=UPI003DA1E17D